MVAGTDIAEVIHEVNFCVRISTKGEREWKDHLEEYSRAQPHGNLVADAFPPS